MAIQRSWYAQCQFPNRMPFALGTVFTEDREGSETATIKIETLCDEIFQTRPKIVKVVPGAVIIISDSSEIPGMTQV